MTRGWFKGFDRPPVWAVLAMAVAVVAVVVLGALASRHPKDPLSAPDAARLAAAEKSAEQSEQAPTRSIAFLGDSYTEGLGDGVGYVPVVCPELSGWRCLNFGEAGTGYVNPGSVRPGEKVYLGRVPDVVAKHPDVVVIQGSTNDTADPGKVEAAATQVYAALKTGLPNAKVIVVGPANPPATANQNIGRIVGELAASTHDAGLPFIDPIAGNWLPPSDTALFASDGLHPDGAGYQRFGDDLATALKPLLPATGS